MSPRELSSPSQGVGHPPHSATPVLPQQGGEAFPPVSREPAVPIPPLGETSLREGRETGQQAATSTPVKDGQEHDR